ncbi:MAG: hypothetical protein HQ569_01260 [Actinobacteria bacterium]|nr:hypothetical protein [Actinomycetota bacterium]
MNTDLWSKRKKIIIICGTALGIFLILFLNSCTNLADYVPIEKYNELQSTYAAIDDKYIKSNQDRIDLGIENKSLKVDVGNVENKIESYKNLINNLNDLLANVYYGYAENNKNESDGFTAFSINYNDKYYLITAGHAAHYKYNDIDTGVYTYFKFKANFSNEWIYPKLLTYENDFMGNRDYAILYSDKITNGLDFDLNNSYPEYILGNEDNNIFKQFDIYNLVEGESGSPVVDIDGEVIGIATGNFVDIDLVIEAIDNLNNQYYNKDNNTSSNSIDNNNNFTNTEVAFFDKVYNLIDEYSLAINHMNVYHGDSWIINDPESLALEETFLIRLNELTEKIISFSYPNSLKNDRNNLVNISREIYNIRVTEVEYMRNNDYANYVKYNDLFNNTVKKFSDYYNSIIK